MLVVIGFLIDQWRNQKVRYSLLLILLSLFFVTKNPPIPSITMVDIGQGDSIFYRINLIVEIF